MRKTAYSRLLKIAYLRVQWKYHSSFCMIIQVLKLIEFSRNLIARKEVLTKMYAHFIDQAGLLIYLIVITKYVPFFFRSKLE